MSPKSRNDRVRVPTCIACTTRVLVFHENHRNPNRTRVVISILLVEGFIYKESANGLCLRFMIVLMCFRNKVISHGGI